MSEIYHIHGRKRWGDWYTICKGNPNDRSNLFGHDCSYQTVTLTYWGAKRWIKKQYKKKKDRRSHWEMPIVGAFIDEPGKEETDQTEGAGGDRGGRSQGSP